MLLETVVGCATLAEVATLVCSVEDAGALDLLATDEDDVELADTGEAEDALEVVALVAEPLELLGTGTDGLPLVGATTTEVELALTGAAEDALDRLAADDDWLAVTGATMAELEDSEAMELW